MEVTSVTEKSYKGLKVGYTLASDERFRIVTVLGTADPLYSNGVSLLTISKATGIDKQNLPYHVTLLLDAGLIKENATKNGSTYKLSDFGKNFLEQELGMDEEYFGKIRKRVRLLDKKKVLAETEPSSEKVI